MLLEDVRKLKVAELRAELRDRGLDPKGLKAELVARLLTAIDTTAPDKNADSSILDTESVQIAQETPKVTCQTENMSTGATSCTASEDNQPGSGQNQSGVEEIWTTPRSSIDQGTQTENDTAVSVSSSVCCCSNKREKIMEGDQIETQTVLSSSDSHQEEVQSAPLFQLPHMTGTEKQNEGVGNINQPDGERGRDYYEFKEEIQYMRAKTPEPCPASEDEMDIDDDTVRLDPYNSDLHFEVSADGSSGQPFLWEKFPLLHSGCRLTHGFTHGKVGFEVKYVKRLSAAAVTSDLPEHHVLRAGWSVDGSSLQLGEEALSFGFDGQGKAVTGGKTEEFGEPFSEGDVIGCYAFISDSGETELSFSKNGRFLGVPFRLAGSTLGGRALYPHVLCKNCSVSLNLDSQGLTWYPGPPGYCPLVMLPSEHRIQAPLPPSHRKDCEVLLMVGMPGSGKSFWVESHMAKNPEKRYNVLSTDTILHCIRLSNPEHKNLMLQQATQCLTHLIRIAASRRRNFILDQANIYPSAQKHKLLSFSGYQKKAVVIVPSDEEWKRRLQQKEQREGAVLSETCLLKIKASFTLPDQRGLLDDVLFVELCQEEAQKLLTSYKEEATRLLPTPAKRKRHKKRPHKRHGDAHGLSQGRMPFAQHSQWGYLKQNGWNFSAFSQPYGYNSDPQRYRDYYQPCTEQWNLGNQSQCYYGNQNYYFGNQAFW
ncbi:Heterogeneous nuclear ribonucleoprotein U-like protein 1 [Bagarius yarrelli]|uniref:Heterogeneous nuclear ribonucleoprotein U-like protein 1 n=1 Tax=Bagarius yarrelli TaxID=175774 RepID=A0A556UZU4_BAGYA|nr:Heterogeneous nuclear ribonucleoprotein U-like protein 1 [Bagarius yarrelli]